MLVWALLLAALATIAWFAWDDRRDYARFKLLTESRDRQARYRVWVVKSFLLFLGMPLAGLALLGRTDALWGLPADFVPAVAMLPGGSWDDAGSLELIFTVAGAILLGSVAGTFFAARDPDAMLKSLGDIAPLMPHNGAETAHTALLSVNAGLVEEVFFRLYLPLLMVLAGVPAAAAFLIAALLFGAAHAYQGWKGIVATGLIGVVMTMVYLGSGSLLLPILLHMAMDLNGLVLRPILTRLMARR